MTKRQKQIIDNYNKSTNYSLDDVYDNYSVFKARAERQILNEMASTNGWGYKILGANTCSFSCAYLKQNEIDGQIEIVYHTAQNKKVFDYIGE
jgi:hypothetical protein